MVLTKVALRLNIPNRRRVKPPKRPTPTGACRERNARAERWTWKIRTTLRKSAKACPGETSTDDVNIRRFFVTRFGSVSRKGFWSEGKSRFEGVGETFEPLVAILFFWPNVFFLTKQRQNRRMKWIGSEPLEKTMVASFWMMIN